MWKITHGQKQSAEPRRRPAGSRESVGAKIYAIAPRPRTTAVRGLPIPPPIPTPTASGSHARLLVRKTHARYRLQSFSLLCSRILVGLPAKAPPRTTYLQVGRILLVRERLPMLHALGHPGRGARGTPMRARALHGCRWCWCLQRTTRTSQVK